MAAANQEHVIAMFRIGVAFFNGRGVEQNDESAFEWFMKASEKGDKFGQFNVGVCFEEGRGVDVDLVQAMHWYRKSAAQEYQQAIDGVERLNHN